MATTRFKAGKPKTGGRKKGVANKVTVAVKDALTSAFAAAGGVKALSDFAKENPAAFYALWAKMLPVEAQLTGEGRLVVEVIYSDE